MLFLGRCVPRLFREVEGLFDDPDVSLIVLDSHPDVEFPFDIVKSSLDHAS